MTPEALEWFKAGVEYVKYISPVLVGLLALAARLRWVKRNGDAQVAKRPDHKKVDELIANGLTEMEQRLLERLKRSEARHAECENARLRDGEQNRRLVETNTRLVERIAGLLTRKEGGA